MKFQQNDLDEFLTTIRCDVKYTLDEFKKLMVNVCVKELNLSPTALFDNLISIEFHASPTKYGVLMLKNYENQYFEFEITYDDIKITNIKIKESINGKKCFNEKNS